jgi:HD-like signal output (HDOD) protein
LDFALYAHLVTAILARQLPRAPQSPAHRAVAARLWEHNAYVSALAKIIASRVTHQDAETALFAGMVHEIGGFYLISRAEDFPGLLEGEPADWLGEDSGEDEVVDNDGRSG